MQEFTGLFAIFFAAIFTNNILLTNYLGMCSFLGASREVKTSLGLGAAVVFVMSTTSMLNWVVYNAILVPLHLEHFKYIVFIIVIAAFVQIVEMIIERVSPPLYFALGIFLPLKRIGYGPEINPVHILVRDLNARPGRIPHALSLDAH